MTLSSTFTLIDPQNGNLAFKLFTFDDGSTFDHIQRLNYYSLIWVQEGKGNAKVETTQFDFNANTLFSFVPYQPFMLKAEKEFKL